MKSTTHNHKLLYCIIRRKGGRKGNPSRVVGWLGEGNMIGNSPVLPDISKFGFEAINCLVQNTKMSEIFPWQRIYLLQYYTTPDEKHDKIWINGGTTVQ